MVLLLFRFQQWMNNNFRRITFDWDCCSFCAKYVYNICSKFKAANGSIIWSSYDKFRPSFYGIKPVYSKDPPTTPIFPHCPLCVVIFKGGMHLRCKILFVRLEATIKFDTFKAILLLFEHKNDKAVRRLNKIIVYI